MHVAPRCRKETIRGDQIEHEGYRCTIDRYFAEGTTPIDLSRTCDRDPLLSMHATYLRTHTRTIVLSPHATFRRARRKVRPDVEGTYKCPIKQMPLKMHEPIAVTISSCMPAVFPPRGLHPPSFFDSVPERIVSNRTCKFSRTNFILDSYISTFHMYSVTRTRSSNCADDFHEEFRHHHHRDDFTSAYFLFRVISGYHAALSLPGCTRCEYNV